MKQHFHNKSLPKRGQTLIRRIFSLYLCLVIKICFSCCCKDIKGVLHVFLPTISTILLSQIPWQTLRDKEISIQIQSPIYMLQKLKEICENKRKRMTTTTYIGEVVRLSRYLNFFCTFEKLNIKCTSLSQSHLSLNIVTCKLYTVREFKTFLIFIETKVFKSIGY